jgi:hypothetical protein
MDRFEDIKSGWPEGKSFDNTHPDEMSNVEWLIAEVERLRSKKPIVDAASLSEGFHVAFRKGCDHPSAAKVHAAIASMDNAAYGEAISWLISSMGWEEAP